MQHFDESPRPHLPPGMVALRSAPNGGEQDSKNPNTSLRVQIHAERIFVSHRGMHTGVRTRPRWRLGRRRLPHPSWAALEKVPCPHPAGTTSTIAEQDHSDTLQEGRDGAILESHAETNRMFPHHRGSRGNQLKVTRNLLRCLLRLQQRTSPH